MRRGYWNDFSKEELRGIAKENGIDTSGKTRRQLITRLNKAMRLRSIGYRERTNNASIHKSV